MALFEIPKVVRQHQVPKFFENPTEESIIEDIKRIMWNMWGAPGKPVKEKVEFLHWQVYLLLVMYKAERHWGWELERMLAEIRYSIIVLNYTANFFDMMLIVEINGNIHRLKLSEA